eukprot:scaffold93541_cov43-Cyclotella_meneghiniana.AAC.1
MNIKATALPLNAGLNRNSKSSSLMLLLEGTYDGFIDGCVAMEHQSYHMLCWQKVMAKFCHGWILRAWKCAVIDGQGGGAVRIGLTCEFF